VAAALRSRLAPYAALRLRALTGDEPEATALIAATIEGAVEDGQGMAATAAYWAEAVLCNGLGDYHAAAEAAAKATTDTAEPWVSMWALPELIEALVHLGDDGPAQDAMARLATAADPCDTAFSHGITARSRALVSAGPDAGTLYAEAIDRLLTTTVRPELARAHLLYGEWLRRQGRRADARTQLRTAYEQLAGIGMAAFAERARRELLATGETVRRRTILASAADGLTAQERQIALLVRDGLSNPEVGTRLFLSPRTVEWHLRKIFVKLAISSRRQLRDALDRDDPALTTTT
jgi:ATP/maltotriose-dependent transcriptional regulator MalT